MSGIVGWVKSPRVRDGRVRFQEALELLRHGPRFTSSVELVSGNLLLGAVRRAEPSLSAWATPDEEVATFLYGRALRRNNTWQAVAAADVGDAYLDAGLAALFALDGSFTIVIVDKRKDRLFLINDRTGSIPVLFAAGDDGFVFGPEGKCVMPLAGIRPRLDAQSVAEFVNLGYPVGTHTMFQGVEQLPPGTCLEIGMADGSRRAEQYWDLRFAPQDRLRKRDAVEMFDAAAKEAVDAALADGPDKLNLLLTGGYDSRVLLGWLMSRGRQPEETLTWGVDPAIPNSDPQIAQEIAEFSGIRHRFLRYDADSFVEEAREWAWVSELSSDNFGNFAAGADFLERKGVNPEVPVFIADQMIGPGGVPATPEQAVENVTKVPWGGIAPGLTTLVDPLGEEEVSSRLRFGLESVIAGAHSQAPKDVQDYLYFHLYVIRWLYAAAYFREPMVSPRRPFMLKPMLDVEAALPERFRVDKMILTRALKHAMPALASFPVASAHSLVDWEWQIRRRGALGELFRKLLRWDCVARTPIAGMLGRVRFRESVERYFTSVPAPVSRHRGFATRAVACRRRLGGLPLGLGGILVRTAEPLARRLVGGSSDPGVGVVLRRIALVCLFQSEFEDGVRFS